MVLRMNVVAGPVLKPKVYRPEKSFRRADGSYPQELAYKDYVELENITDQAGKPVKLLPGMVIEYWLEATDNCDYPEPNVGKSEPHKRVRIVEPQHAVGQRRRSASRRVDPGRRGPATQSSAG